MSGVLGDSQVDRDLLSDHQQKDQDRSLIGAVTSLETGRNTRRRDVKEVPGSN